MFSDDVLEKIFSARETVNIPVGYVSDVIRAIERILEEENADKFQPGNSGAGDISFL